MAYENIHFRYVEFELQGEVNLEVGGELKFSLTIDEKELPCIFKVRDYDYENVTDDGYSVSGTLFIDGEEVGEQCYKQYRYAKPFMFVYNDMKRAYFNYI